jgi:glycosyltransferase involved in cell wall biosynthesis
VNISFCLITLNEQENLRRCLRSCADLADEIIILDSGSTDDTEAIAREFGARFERQAWLGYVGQKNRVIGRAALEWVFSIDADEELSPELRQEVAGLKKGGLIPGALGYSMPRCVFYEGRWIKHGDWYPDRLTRLFRRDQARFAGGKVHERLEVSGPVHPLKGDLFHYSFKDATDHWARCEKYARLWVESKREAGKTAGALSPYLHGAFRWFRGYFLKRGFLDGPQGRRIADICAREVFLKYRLLHEATKRGALTQPKKPQ